VIRFPELESLGVTVAAMSDKFDGDCRRESPYTPGARSRFCAACGVEESDLVLAHQVHGAKVARAGESDRGRGAVEWSTAFGESDGIITDVPGLPLGVGVADCAPVYLVEPERRVVGVVHAGRMGTMKRVTATAVAALECEFGAKPARVHAVIGPSAGPRAYEVSKEIALECAQSGMIVRGRYVDLWESNAAQLERAGVPRSNIRVSGICTIVSGRFHSHRADANGARNLAIIML
jgi:hypothetical protein